MTFQNKFTFGSSSCSDSPVLREGYWHGFWKRNGNLLECKRGQKYATDRDNWTTYRNFKDMYSHVYNEMVDAGVAE